MKTLTFRTDDVICLYAFIYVSAHQPSVMLEIARHLTGRNLTAQDTYDMKDSIASALAAQHPFLAELDIPRNGDAQYNHLTLNSWLNEATDRHGLTLDIAQQEGL
jgi:hypothetical protein